MRYEINSLCRMPPASQWLFGFLMRWHGRKSLSSMGHYSPDTFDFGCDFGVGSTGIPKKAVAIKRIFSYNVKAYKSFPDVRPGRYEITAASLYR